MLKRPAIFFLRIYQKCISPLLGHTCKFTPSCSEYSIESIEKLGLIRGIYYSVLRISRCHPLFNDDYEYDPVRKK